MVVGRRLVVFLVLAAAALVAASPVCAEPGDAMVRARALLGPRSGATPVRVLVVTIPDPDSFVGWHFDRYLDAVLRALEAERFRQDRFDLPWNPKSDTPVAGAESKGPGLILFRGAAPDDPHLLLVLVGESPTLGIDRPALREAIELARAFGGADPVVRIVGPSFSGSVRSMAETLAAWWPRSGPPATGRAEIVSGSATNPGNPAEFAARVGAGVWYGTTIPDDDRVLRAAGAFFRRVLGPSDKVALLTEGNTAYGQIQPGQAWQQPLVTLPFPTNISDLRSAAAESRRDPGADAAPGTAQETGILGLTLAEGRAPADILTAFGGEMSSRTKQLLLADIFSALDREDIRVVGLLATNVKDKLFLAEQIYRHAPDVRLFTLESDILLAHPQYARFTRGMVVFSGYPLYAPNRTWTDGDAASRVLFPSDVAQGVYNAARWLLRRSNDAAPPAGGGGLVPAADGLLEYAAPFSKGSTGPCVWASVVGRNGIFPVRLLDCPEPRATLAAPGTRGAPRIATFVLLALLAGATVLAVVYFLARRRTPMRGAASVFVLWMRRLFAGGSGKTESLAVGMLFLVLAALSAYAATLVIAARALTSGRITAVVVAAAIAATLLTAAAAVDVLFVRARRSMGTVAAALVVAAVAIALAGSIANIMHRDPRDRLLLLERSMQFESGVSPVVPAVLLGAVLSLALFCQLRRAALLRQFPVVEEMARLAPVAAGGVSDLERRIGGALLQRWDVLRRFAVGFTVVMLPVGFLVASRYVRSFESAWFDAVVLGAALAAIAMIGLAVMQLMLLWSHTRALLSRLAGHPLAGAYDRVSPLAAKVRQRRFGTALPTLGELRRALDAYGLAEGTLGLAAPLVRDEPSGKDTLDDVHSRLPQPRLLSAMYEKDLDDPDGPESTDLAASRAYRELSRGVPALAGVLRSSWARRPVPPPAGSGAAAREGTAGSGADQAPQDIGSWVALVENVLAMQVVAVLRHLLAHLRNLMIAMTAGSALFVFALRSYPFQPHRVLVAASVLQLVVAIAASLTVLVQVDRNEVISRLSDTTPGRISWDWSFFLRVGTYVALPLFSLLAAEIPASTIVTGWFEPLIQALR